MLIKGCEAMRKESINWKLSFVLEGDRPLISDNCILIDDRYVFVDPLPASLTPEKLFRIERRKRRRRGRSRLEKLRKKPSECRPLRGRSRGRSGKEYPACFVVRTYAFW
ncbi:hypothetical protein [Pontiella sp.]|uniref:hypothetical protein n=1 Tax=Pontiella sp. TaxID=2837462 RepID=UPI003565F0A5